MTLHTSGHVLGDMDVATFLSRHWQKKPLVVRQAVADMRGLPNRSRVFALAAAEEVESRLVVRQKDERWSLKHGPLTRRLLPPLTQADWTVLVQGVDMHDEATRALLDRFRFIPDARIDDAMFSFATSGGGVGAHVDSYDVFLLQVAGQRRWRIGPAPRRPILQEDMPLRILADFQPTAEYLLEPGDMLYLPPGYAHEGVAVGECLTCSIGFRAPAAGELARRMLERIADDATTDEPATGWKARLYSDKGMSAASDSPAEVPQTMQAFAREAMQRMLSDPDALDRALGCWLTEPKPMVWFDEGSPLQSGEGVMLSAKTRMLFDERQLYINGESVRASGADARLMHLLATQRALPHSAIAKASDAARSLLNDWCEAGWLESSPSF